MSTPMSTDQESMLLSDDDNEKSSGRSTYASFGNNGVTATANSHGHLLQITRYMEHEPPGFFCVDLTDILPSHPVIHRMKKLQDYCTDSNSGVGVEVRIKQPFDIDAHIGRQNEVVTKLSFVHDRWPRFVSYTPEFYLSTQYFVSEKTVYQIYTLKPYQGEDHFAEIPQPAINIELFLRNLSIKPGNYKDHSTSNNNDTQNPHCEEYSNHLSPGNDYIIRTRNIRNTAHGNQEVIALYITPFINKRHQQLSFFPISGDCHIILEDSVLEDLRQGNEVEVTLAYRLELISSGEVEFNYPVSSESLCNAEAVLGSPFKIPVLTQDDRFNVNLRRNLEHILSVCSIPVDSDADGNNPSIALTCGDISGHRISTEASFNPNLLQQSLITFFRATKSYESTKVRRFEIADGFRTIVRKWAAALDEKNKGRHLVFPNLRKKREQLMFHLSDHAIIWWAVKSVEELGLWEELRVNENLGTCINRDGVIYSSNRIRASLLKKFSIRNSSFEKHMIAVFRSSNETRFQFRAQDTVLFYAMDLGLFDQDDLVENESSTWQNKIEAWRCTVNYQKECEDDKNARWDWDQPLRCALALIMPPKSKRKISHTIPKMHREAKSILLLNSFSDELFKGLLDEDRGLAALNDEAATDLFWSATFEVPYILLKYSMAQPLSEALDLSVTTAPPLPKSSSISPSILSTEPTKSAPTRDLARSRTMPVAPTEILTGWESLLMNRAVLFTNIDLENIVEIPDEWLYNEPRFFSFHATLSEAIIGEFYSPNGSRADVYSMKVLYDAVMADGPLRGGEPMGYIIDVPRVRRYRKKNEYRSWKILSSSDLLSHLNIKRTPTNAKKRIFHFSPARWNIAMLCCLASSEPEEVSSFFDRHALSNPWILSPQKSAHLIKSILEPETRRTIYEPHIIQFPPSDSKGTIKTLSRAVISFRFDGDLLDRHWTCHLIEYRPEQSDDPEDIFNITTGPRRVLELVFSTEEILTEARGMLRASKVAENIDQSHRIAESDSKLLSIPNRGANPHNVFCLSTQSLYKIQEVIQDVEDNLNEVFAKVELWKNRQNDEYRYGAAVSKLRASNDTYAEELLTRQIDASRYDRETRISEDARLFTIVFIPVTLATGVLSMGEIPSISTIYYMLALTAIIYLVNLTLFPNTKTIVKILQYMVSQVSNCLLYLSGRSQQSIVEITRSFNEITVEAGFFIVGLYLHCLYKMYEWAKEHNVPAQEATTTCVRSKWNLNPLALLSKIIYCFTFYAYLPLRKATEKLFPDATLHDPISSFSLDDHHPIQKAHVAFQEASNNARKDDEFGGLLNNLGQRNSGNLFTIWRKRLSEAGYIPNVPLFMERRRRRQSSQLAS
ncbi:hypothetical protein J3E68DRAFT_448658 [Trichoderma sp. SZMC 28012]